MAQPTTATMRTGMSERTTTAAARWGRGSLAKVRFVVLSILRAALVLLITTFLVFNLSALFPGDPASAIAGEGATAADIERIRDQLGLNRPWYIQYFTWLFGLLRGDFGESLFYNVPVSELIALRIPPTFSIGILAILIAVVFGVLVGIVSAAYRGRTVDRIATITSTLGIVTPNFWVGMILVIVFSFTLKLLPAVGYTPFEEDPWEWFLHLILPAVALALAAGAELQRQTRSSVSDVLTEDYIRTARSQGLPERVVVWQRGLKNGAIPIVTVVGFTVSILLGGTIVIERVFSIPGLGTLAINSVVTKDLPVLQGVVIVNVIIVILANLVTDLVYTVLNPKVRIS